MDVIETVASYLGNSFGSSRFVRSLTLDVWKFS